MKHCLLFLEEENKPALSNEVSWKIFHLKWTNYSSSSGCYLHSLSQQNVSVLVWLSIKNSVNSRVHNPSKLLTRHKCNPWTTYPEVDALTCTGASRLQRELTSYYSAICTTSSVTTTLAGSCSYYQWRLVREEDNKYTTHKISFVSILCSSHFWNSGPAKKLIVFTLKRL